MGSSEGAGARHADRFRPLRELGRGGMGAVELVDDAQRGEHVARKRVLRAADPRALVRFKREFRAIEHLTHPSLVRLFELGEDDDGLFFTMELVDGHDLASYVTRRGEGATTESGPVFSGATTDATLDALTPSRITGIPSVLPGAVLPEAVSGVVSADAPTLASDDAHASGVTFRSERRPAPRPSVDLERLAHVLPQLLEGLAFLHAHDIVHRDLKPANVLVSRHGALKILDFGILAETGAAHESGELVGTLGYMAPEQARGAAPSSATDLYALGAILFELFAGRLPFVGAGLALLTESLTRPAPSLAELAPDAPPAVVDACAALLDADPTRRPTLAELARTLLPALGARAPVLSRPRERRPELLGRDPELALLGARRAAAARGELAFVAITGPTGAGKSALVAHLADDAERSGALVLRGRARATERVAFNGIDEAVDALALSLARSRRALDPADGADRALAATLFPTLAEPHEPALAPVGRTIAVAALVRLIRRAAARAGLLVWIVDDAQWADADALAVLAQIADDAPPRVLFVATVRDDVGETLATATLHAHAELVTLAPLADDVLTAIARSIANVDVDEAKLRSAVAACAGRPLLAEVVARALARGVAVDEPRVLLAHAVRDASPLERDVTAILVAADGWMSVGELGATLEREVTPGACDDAVRSLASAGVLRRSGPVGPDGRAALYHDAVRVAAIENLGPEALAHAHGRLADRLRAIGGPDARVVHHLVGAARIDEAASLARSAALHAEHQGAYGLAAELYEVALQRPHSDERSGERSDERSLRASYAHVLDRATRCVDAAKVWRALADDAPTFEEKRSAMLSEACSLLAANAVSEGRARLDAALALSGDPTTRPGLGGLLAGLVFLWGPPRRSPRALPPPRATSNEASPSNDTSNDTSTETATTRGTTSDPRARTANRDAERDVRLGVLVGYFDPLAGLRFLRRARVAFDRRGDLERAAWIELVFSYFALFGSRRSGPVPLADRYRLSGLTRVHGRVASSLEVDLMPRFLDGVTAQRDGRWSDAFEALQEVVDAFEDRNLHGTFEHMMALVHCAQIPYFAQHLDDADAWLKHFAEAARSSEDSAMRCHVDFLAVQIDTLRGNVEEAAARGGEVRARWGAEPTFQRFVAHVETASPNVFVGDVREARARIERSIRDHARFRPLHSMYGGSFGTIAALCEATALRSGDPSASARRVDRYASWAEGACPLGTSGAWRARAYAADARGAPEVALRWLARAAAEAERFAQPIDLAIASYQRGLRLGGEEGATLCREAREAIVAAGSRELLLHEDAGRR